MQMNKWLRNEWWKYHFII